MTESATPRFAYQGPPLRSVGTSCMAAIGVPSHIYIWIGGWTASRSVVAKHYIDPTVLPSPAAYAFWGWALGRQYSADAGVACRPTVLPDPRAS